MKGKYIFVLLASRLFILPCCVIFCNMEVDCSEIDETQNGTEQLEILTENDANTSDINNILEQNESQDESHIEESDGKCPDDISRTIDDGPVQPRMTVYPKTVFGTCRTARSFCANWYDRFPWLEYSISLDKAFCFACRHFGTEDPKKLTIYASTGFSKWGKAHDRLQRHNNSSRHLAAMQPWLEDTLRRENEEGIETVTSENKITETVPVKKEKKHVSPVATPKRGRGRPRKNPISPKSPVVPALEHHSENLTWCSCTKCQAMQDPQKCVCCSDVKAIQHRIKEINPPLKCITDHPGFRAVCLNHWVLQVAYYQHRQEMGELSVTKDYERYRYIAYCQFVRWCWGYLTEDMHVPLPSCVVSMIKLMFNANSSVHPSLCMPST